MLSRLQAQLEDSLQELQDRFFTESQTIVMENKRTPISLDGYLRPHCRNEESWLFSLAPWKIQLCYTTMSRDLQEINLSPIIWIKSAHQRVSELPRKTVGNFALSGFKFDRWMMEFRSLISSKFPELWGRGEREARTLSFSEVQLQFYVWNEHATQVKRDYGDSFSQWR